MQTYVQTARTLEIYVVWPFFSFSGRRLRGIVVAQNFVRTFLSKLPHPPRSRPKLFSSLCVNEVSTNGGVQRASGNPHPSPPTPERLRPVCPRRVWARAKTAPDQGSGFGGQSLGSRGEDLIQIIASFPSRIYRREVKTTLSQAWC